MQRQLKETVRELLRVLLQGTHPLKTDVELAEMQRARLQYPAGPGSSGSGEGHSGFSYAPVWVCELWVQATQAGKTLVAYPAIKRLLIRIFTL